MLRFKTILVLVPILFYGCSNPLDVGDGVPLSTIITYNLPADSHVKLWVENSYKTSVATLVDEVQQAGFHNVTFNAVDSNGNNLPEGLYTYHLETNSHSQSRVLNLFYR